MGEVYTTITNGPGYQSYDKDRFKDFAARLTLTPFGNQSGMSPIIRSFAISPWVTRAHVGSSFAGGGAGQVGPGQTVRSRMSEACRYGVFAGVRDRRISAGAEWAQRIDDSETGSNTTLTPRVLHDSTGRVVDGFVVARPLEWADASAKSALSVSPASIASHRTPARRRRTTRHHACRSIRRLGGSWDLNQRITLASIGRNNPPPGFPHRSAPISALRPDASNIVFHFQATF